MSARLATDLRAAAEVLRRDGHCKRQYHTKDGRHCAEGAIGLATGIQERQAGGGWRWSGTLEQHVRYKAALNALESWLTAHHHAPYRVLVGARHWNDKRDRTADEVIAALEAAADAAEAEQP